jgi:hypothetical protein
MSALGHKQTFKLLFGVIDWVPGREPKLRMANRGTVRQQPQTRVCLGWWKLLNIGAIGFTLAQSEKAGEHTSPDCTSALPDSPTNLEKSRKQGGNEPVRYRARYRGT